MTMYFSPPPPPIHAKAPPALPLGANHDDATCAAGSSGAPVASPLVVKGIVIENQSDNAFATPLMSGSSGGSTNDLDLSLGKSGVKHRGMRLSQDYDLDAVAPCKLVFSPGSDDGSQIKKRKLGDHLPHTCRKPSHLEARQQKHHGQWNRLHLLLP